MNPNYLGFDEARWLMVKWLFFVTNSVLTDYTQSTSSSVKLVSDERRLVTLSV